MPMSTITVAGINPGLNVLGNTQQLNYTQPLSAFQLTNSFVATISVPSQLNHEYRNNVFSGFRWTHLTTSTDTHGSLTLQSFVNAQSTGTDIVKFTESGGMNIYVPFIISNNLDMDGFEIINLANPTTSQSAATKNYVDAKSITLSGAVTGTGTIGTTIATTLTNITISQISNLFTARLDQFAAPNVSVSLGSQKIINLLDPTLEQDGATKNYVDTSITTAIGTTVLSVTGTATRISSTGGQNPTIDLIDTSVTAGSYTNSSLTVDAAGRLTAASSGITGIVAALYISTSAPTTLATAAFTKIAGTTTTTFLKNANFDSPSNNQIRYLGTDTINTKISVDLTAVPVNANSTIGIGISKNGSTTPEFSPNYAYQLTAGSSTLLNLSIYVQLSTMDYIEVLINNDAPTNVTVTNMNLTIVT